MPVTLTVRIDEELAKLLDEIAKKEGMDRSTVIRRFLLDASKEWQIAKSLEEYERGRITLWQAAGRCGLSLWEMIDEVRKREVRMPYALEDLRKDLDGLGHR